MRESIPESEQKSRRLRFGSVALAVAFIVLVAISLFSVTRDEPIHKGKRLSYWLTALNGPPEGRLAATNAVLEMGTNIVPYLLQMRFAMPTKGERMLQGLVHRVLPKYQTSTEKGRYMGMRGLRTLGAAAAPFVVPYLSSEDLVMAERRDYNSHIAFQAADVLLYDIGPPAIPAVKAAMTNSNPTIRYHACYALAFRPAREILKAESLAPLAPVVIERLHDTDYRVRWIAVRAAEPIIRNSKGDAQNIISNICLCLDDSASSVRLTAAAFLNMLGKDAQMAVPHLLNALSKEGSRNTNTVSGSKYFDHKTSQQVESAISNAIRVIDPEAFAKIQPK